MKMILILLPALMASACGMQGELYLPDEAPDAGTKDSAGKSSVYIVAFNTVEKT